MVLSRPSLHTAVVVAGIILIACARAPSESANRPISSPTMDSTASASPPETLPPGMAPDWSRPLTNGIAIHDLSEAKLGFVPDPPSQALGEAETIFQTSPDGTSLKDRAIAWVFESPAVGLFSVIEQLPTLTQSELESLVACGVDEAGCDASGFALVSVRDGVQALFNTGSASTSVRWLEAGLQYVVVGPSSTLTRDEVIQIANDL